MWGDAYVAKCVLKRAQKRKRPGRFQGASLNQIACQPRLSRGTNGLNACR
jgi:hypothetical protein